MSIVSSRDSHSKKLIQEANRCVACGLCLPHCPTYRKTESEADSPRGRIALMKGVLENRIPLNQRFVQHIDLCLTCRACENVCPSNVEYGQLVDGVRPLIRQFQPRNDRLLETLASPLRLRMLARALRFYQKSGLQTLIRKSSLLTRLGVSVAEAELPELPPMRSWRELYPATGIERGKVGLFLGCVTRLLDGETLCATIFVLNRLGYTVHIPKRQGCCGALKQHAGDAAGALGLARGNIEAFGSLNLDAIISTASGCGAMLSEYHKIFEIEDRAFSAKVNDVGAFLAQADGWAEIKMQPLAAKIVVQDPCTLRNVLHADKFPYALLKRIPEAVVEPLPGNDQCCGAAGMYHLEQPEMAGLLRNDKMAALRRTGARYLATSNVGCALWLAQGLRERGMKMEVVHPVTLVARQMGFKGKC